MDPQRLAELSQLMETLGHRFADPATLQAALCHSSYVNEHPEEGERSNERMEFLGDAVLELAVTHLLYLRLPGCGEGALSRARAAVVNTARLASIARHLDLGRFLLLGRGEESQNGRRKPGILADALEAVVAAIYLDGGLEAVQVVLEHLVGPLPEQDSLRAPDKDHKTLLQEKVQESLHITPRYHLVATHGPEHEKVFQVALEIEGQVVAHGSGRSKKEAEQDAAAKALESWGAEE